MGVKNISSEINSLLECLFFGRSDEAFVTAGKIRAVRRSPTGLSTRVVESFALASPRPAGQAAAGIAAP